MGFDKSLAPKHIHHHKHKKKAAAKISAQSAWALTEVVRFNMITDKARSWERGMCIWKRQCVGLCLYHVHTHPYFLLNTPRRQPHFTHCDRWR